MTDQYVDIPGANFVKDVGYIALESVEVTPSGEVTRAIDICHGAAQTIEALHVDPVLCDLVAHLLIRD